MLGYGALGQLALGQFPNIGGIVPSIIHPDYDGRKRRKKPRKERIDYDIERENKLHSDLWAAFHPPSSTVSISDVAKVVVARKPFDVTQLAQTIVKVGEQNRTKRMKADQDDEEDLLAMILEGVL